MTFNIKNNPLKPAGRVASKGTGPGVRIKVVPPTVTEAPTVWSSYLLAWYRSDDVVMNDSSYVTRVNDKSGNGRHLGQGGGNSYCPTLETNTGGAFGNHDTWRFTGSPQRLTGSVWDLDGASDVGYTIFHVYAGRAYGASKGIWDLSTDQNTNNYGLAAYDEYTTGIVRTGVSYTLSFTQPSQDAPLVFTTNWRTGSSGNTCQAWINGSSVSGPTALVGAGTSNPSHLRLGSLWQDVWWFNSSQAEFLLFSGTLPAAARAEIETYLMNRYNIAPPPGFVRDGLTLYLDASAVSSYPAAGSKWYDLSANGNTATLYSSPTYSSSGPKYLDFGSGPAYATIDLNDSLRPATGLTEAVWVNLPSNTSLRVAVATQKGSGNENSYALFMVSNNWYGLVNTSLSGVVFSAGTPPSAGSWQHVVHTYDGANQKIYVNGVLMVTTPTAGTMVYDNNNTKLTIGMNYDGSGYDAGVAGDALGGVSSVHFYNRALTDAEVVQNFNVDAARHGLPTI